MTHWGFPGWASRRWALSGCRSLGSLAQPAGLFPSAGWFWSGHRTWEIRKDPFRGSSCMLLCVNCWAEGNALFYVFNSGRTSPPPQQPVQPRSLGVTARQEWLRAAVQTLQQAGLEVVPAASPWSWRLRDIASEANTKIKRFLKYGPYLWWERLWGQTLSPWVFIGLLRLT